MSPRARGGRERGWKRRRVRLTIIHIFAEDRDGREEAPGPTDAGFPGTGGSQWGLSSGSASGSGSYSVLGAERAADDARYSVFVLLRPLTCRRARGRGGEPAVGAMLGSPPPPGAARARTPPNTRLRKTAMLRIGSDTVTLLSTLRPVIAGISRQDRDLARQLRRAATRVPLSLAEGSGQRGGALARASSYGPWICSGGQGVRRGPSGPARRGRADARLPRSMSRGAPGAGGIWQHWPPAGLPGHLGRSEGVMDREG